MAGRARLRRPLPSSARSCAVTRRSPPTAAAASPPPPPGPPPCVNGRITDADGQPISGVEVDVWQSSPAGLYENQDPDQADMNLRGRFHTDENACPLLLDRRVGAPGDARLHFIP